MKFLQSVFLIFSIYNLANQCNAIIIVKFSKVVQHYLKYKAKAHHDRPNSLDDFQVDSRQFLCDAVIEAKQFRIMYYPSEYVRRKKLARDLIPQAFVTGQTTNYQYLMKHFFSEEQLKFKNRLVKLTSSLSEPMKSIQCADSLIVKWFVSYGFLDKFLYTLELHLNEKKPALRMTGLIEPSAVINNREREYFDSQFQTSRDSMESICRLAINDILRLCSSVFDALATKRSLRLEIKRINYFRAERFWCMKKKVRVKGVVRRAKPLRCRIIDEGRDTTLFYVLADARERGAVFVLFETEVRNLLELRMRVTKVGALLNPADSPEVPLQPDTNEESVTEEEEEDSELPFEEPVFEVEDTMDVEGDEREEFKLRNVADIYLSSPRLSSRKQSTKPAKRRRT